MQGNKSNKKLILIVDDEPAIRQMIAFNLDLAGFNCLESENEDTTLAQLKRSQPDLILMDWMLPGKSGLELTRRIRSLQNFQETPIIMVTAKAEENHRVQGLDMGADDYLIKPFSPRELIARINAVLRRSLHEDETGLIKVPGFTLNTVNQTIHYNHSEVKLTATEYRVIYFFLTHRDRIHSRSHIIDHVWGTETYIDERTVDVQIRRVRDVLKKANCAQYIQTVRGSGYRFSIKSMK